MGGWRGGGADVGNHAVDEEQGARVVGGGGRGGVCVCGGGGADVGNNAVDEVQGAVVLGRGRGGGWGGGGGGGLMLGIML